MPKQRAKTYRDYTDRDRDRLRDDDGEFDGRPTQTTNNYNTSERSSDKSGWLLPLVIGLILLLGLIYFLTRTMNNRDNTVVSPVPTDRVEKVTPTTVPTDTIQPTVEPTTDTGATTVTPSGVTR